MKKPLILALGICALSAQIFLLLVLFHGIVFFKHGIVLANTRELHLALNTGEIQKLDWLPSLTSADFSGSTCYADIEAWSKKHPQVHVTYTVSLPASIPVDTDTKTANLTQLSCDEAIEIATQYLQFMPEIEAVTIRPESWDSAHIAQLRAACERLILRGVYEIGSTSVPMDAEEADLSQASIEDLESFAGFVSGMGALKRVILGEDEEHDHLQAAGHIAQANPSVEVSYVFTAYGKRLNFNETYLDFRRIPIDDQGALARELLAAMPHVQTLDMDNSGVDDEHMAAIRDDFPAIEVVWRVFFGSNYTVRTNVEKIMASNSILGGALTPENTQSLKYCTKVKYLDIGHSGTVRDISFVRYMPDLEVFICMWGDVEDISPLADCPHLEFLEIFTNNITDLSPLSGLTELRHLNASNNPGLADISPVFDLNLERFWCGQSNSVPQEQFDRFRELHPECAVNFTCLDPHEGWRWGSERYTLLQQQLGYLTYDYAVPENDPLFDAPPAGLEESYAPAEGEAPAEESAPAAEPLSEG